jgi:hypothetical protein
VATDARPPDLGPGFGVPRAGADVWSDLSKRVDVARWRVNDGFDTVLIATGSLDAALRRGR